MPEPDLSNSAFREPESDAATLKCPVAATEFLRSLAIELKCPTVKEAVDFVASFVNEGVALSISQQEVVRKLFVEDGHLRPETWIKRNGELSRNLNYEVLIGLTDLINSQG